MKFLDTNIIIRYLTGDDEVKAAACLRLLKRVEAGEEELMAAESNVSEVVFVLASPRQYGIPRDEIKARLLPVLTMRGLRLANRDTVLHALDVYASHPGLDFEDALAVAHMSRHGITEIVSYDTGFDKVPGIRRVEPESDRSKDQPELDAGDQQPGGGFRT